MTTTTRSLTLEEAREYLRHLAGEESIRGNLAREALEYKLVTVGRARGHGSMALLQDLGCVAGREYGERAIASRLMSKWPLVTTRAFAVRLSRDVMLKDCLVSSEYLGDPYRETVIPIEISLPLGYEVGESRGGTIEVYSPAGRLCTLMLQRTTRALGGWFRLRGRGRWIIRLLDPDAPPPARATNAPGLPVRVLD